MLFGIQQGPYNRRPSSRSLASLLPLDKGGSQGVAAMSRPPRMFPCKGSSFSLQDAVSTKPTQSLRRDHCPLPQPFVVRSPFPITLSKSEDIL